MNLRRVLAAVLTTTVLACGPAGAASVSGQQLLSLCTANMGGSGNAIEAAECMGYIVGVADTFDCVEAEHGYRWNSRAEVTQPHLALLVIQYLQTHPAARASTGHMIVAQALSDAFPCPKKAASN